MSRKRKQSHVNHERWMVSYADFVTLLFAFFVVMFASSQQDHKKTQQVAYSIRTAFQTMGIFPAVTKEPSLSSVVMIAPQSVPMVTLGDDIASLPGVMEDLNKMKRRMERLLASQIANGTVTVTIGRGGLLISLLDAGFFESGSAIPKASSIPTLNEIGKAIAAAPYNVRIEGHTDDVPIHDSQYASNWELSTARATVLTRLFIEQDHIIPGRLSAAGYAQYHPVASNLTAEGRGRNRRVDIIVLPTLQQVVNLKGLAAGQKSQLLSSRADQQKLQEFLSTASRSKFSRPISTMPQRTPLR
ncbi:MAG TPA: flagellar motor protein MotB [Acidobacteriaceae bacterium]|nr:flagellar motor protein MotB [Terriglobia bacterium]HVC91205.1 flagellar motor protein MotB [Acidobacteriaceae bacterium]